MPKAFNIYPKHPAVNFLASLHADLGGRILANRKEGERLAADMKHVEAVIRMFDPAYNVRAISVRRRNQRNRWFKRGAMFRAVLDVLKAAEGPLTVREIVLRVLAGKGEASPALKTIRDLEGGIRSTLARKVGKTVQNVGQGMPSRWTIIGTN
jgi:hypothetical protein